MAPGGRRAGLACVPAVLPACAPCARRLHKRLTCQQAPTPCFPPLPCCPCLQEGQDYLTAMACAANYAWVNRSSMTFLCRQAFAKMFGATPDDLDMHVVYDVSHNIAKVGRAVLGCVVCVVVAGASPRGRVGVAWSPGAARPGRAGCWSHGGLLASSALSAHRTLPPPIQPLLRWRSTWWAGSRAACWCTARAPLAPSRPTTPSSPWTTSSPGSRCSSAAPWAPAATCSRVGQGGLCGCKGAGSTRSLSPTTSLPPLPHPRPSLRLTPSTHPPDLHQARRRACRRRLGRRATGRGARARATARATSWTTSTCWIR